MTVLLTQLCILYDELLAEGDAAIVCTQPRRVAASECAARVAQEMGVELRQEVGFDFRGKRKISSRTRLMFATVCYLR